MRGISRVIGVGVFVALVMVCGRSAWATMDNFKAYKQAYPEAKATSCKTCHEGVPAKQENLNGYGKALLKLPAPADPKKLTPDDFKAAAAADPDGDGATTAQELEAGTDPSDPASVPKPASGASSAAPKTDGAGTTSESKPAAPGGGQ